jgi:hypothetical protein
MPGEGECGCWVMAIFGQLNLSLAPAEESASQKPFDAFALTG